MTRTTGNANQYLKQLGRTWYVSIRVPRTLEKHVGNTHVRRSLKTRDLSEANRLKHLVVADIKATLEQLRVAHSEDGPAHTTGLTFADARMIRDELRELGSANDTETATELELIASSRAEEIEGLYGYDKAKRWYRAATVTTSNLRELQGQWLKVSDYKESTNMGHRKALAEVLAFLKDEDGHPGDVTRQVAVKYIEEDLTTRGLAYSTIRDRLASLSAFWGWIATRGLVPADANPWSGHKVSKKAHKGSTPPKRAFTDAEVVALLKGTPGAAKWPTMSYLPDLIVLGMFTGAREEELCSAKVSQIEHGKGFAIINVEDAKTQAGVRPVAVTHPAALAVIKRRTHKAEQGAQFFPELKPGGADNKYSFSAVKAFGRYRRVCKVPDGTDFHSFRRCVVTKLEQAGVGQVPIARFVGHKVGTLAGDTYSAGTSKERAVETSLKVRYSAEVEALVTLRRCVARGAVRVG
jgi:integrase